ncbi:MAG: hypothetical protein ACK56F_13110, partial [bacterium]
YYLQWCFGISVLFAVHLLVDLLQHLVLRRRARTTGPQMASRIPQLSLLRRLRTHHHLLISI